MPYLKKVIKEKIYLIIVFITNTTFSPKPLFNKFALMYGC